MDGHVLSSQSVLNSPRARTLLSYFRCSHRQTLRAADGSVWPGLLGARWASPQLQAAGRGLTTDPTSTGEAGLVSCPAFAATHRPPTGPSSLTAQLPSLPSSNFSRNISACWVPLSTSFLTLCRKKRRVVLRLAGRHLTTARSNPSSSCSHFSWRWSRLVDQPQRKAEIRQVEC